MVTLYKEGYMSNPNWSNSTESSLDPMKIVAMVNHMSCSLYHFSNHIFIIRFFAYKDSRMMFYTEWIPKQKREPRLLENVQKSNNHNRACVHQKPSSLHDQDSSNQPCNQFSIGANVALPSVTASNSFLSTESWIRCHLIQEHKWQTQNNGSKWKQKEHFHNRHYLFTTKIFRGQFYVFN